MGRAYEVSPTLVGSVAVTELGLSPQEAVMLDGQEGALLTHIAQTVLYIDELPPGERAQFDQSNRRWFEQPLTRVWFKYMKSSYSPDAVKYLENLVALPSSEQSAPSQIKTS
jgi:hypothetical protein